MALGVPQSSISPEPGARFNTAGAQGLASIQGDQASALGQAGSALGSTLGQIVVDRQNEANQLRVDDALNRLKEEQLRLTYDPKAGFTTQRGIAALERPSGRSLAADYTEQFDTAANGIEAGLGNAPQRAAFARARADLRGQFEGSVTQHETREFTDWSVSVRDGTIGIRVNELGTRWNDSTFDRAAAAESIKAAVADKGRILGWSASEIEIKTLALQSAGHKTALLAALEAGNVGYADAYLTRYASQMTADDLLSVKGQITKEMDATVALTAVEDAFADAAPALNPTDISRFVGVTRSTESNGQRGIAGPPTPSGTAYGTMQVLDTTGAATAKKLGIPWRPDLMRGTSDEAAAYQDRIGTAYLIEQLQAFGGDVRKAWAAYNAGPGWVKAAQSRAALAAPGTQEADWFWQLNNDGRTAANRKQTEDYVNKNAAAFGVGGGAPPRPTLESIIAQIAKDPRLGGDPTRIRLASDEARRRWTLAEGERKQQGEDAVASAIRYIAANPGATYATLPSSIRAALPPTEIDTIQNFAAKQEQTVDDPAAVIQLNDPKYLASLTDSQMLAFRMKLTPGSYAAFVGQRAKLATGGGDRSKDPGYYNADLVNSTLYTQMRAAGMDPSPKASAGSDQRQRAATVVAFVRQEVLLRQQATGRQLNAAETSALVTELFAKHFSYDIKTFGFDTGDKTVNMFDMRIDDVPPDSAKKLRAQLKAATGKDPSDWDVIGAYWRGKLHPAGK